MDHIESLVTEDEVVEVSDAFKAAATEKTQVLYEDSDRDRLAFWADRANELTWFQPFDRVLDWQRPFSKWFLNGKLNASYNCLDVHLQSDRRHKTALLWEGEKGKKRSWTYESLHREVCRFACVLKQHYKLKKGDCVTLYLPMIPELLVAVLACARLGVIHSVVFAGFSAKSLKDRILDSGSSLLITANGGYRRGQVLNVKAIADAALEGNDTPVKSTLVIRHLDESEADFPSHQRDTYYCDLKDCYGDTIAPEPMDSEAVLFILYTSGTTGKPKGIVHTTGGYLTHAKYSTRTVFDLKDTDVYWCTADIGWITGHTYLVYGPLLNGATVLMYEGAPDYPEKDRFWDLVASYSVTILYTAPTAIRAFMKWGDAWPDRHDLSSLRLLGTVGEPINPEAWQWYFKHIGGSRCPIVDTWWQTETGGIMISNIPALNNLKPGFAGLPLPGIRADILDEDGNPIRQGGGLLSLTEPFPSMLRGIWRDEQRFKEVYWDKFETYFAGDGALIDRDGYIKVLGRVDDVLNVAGHRIGTMEVESALVDCPGVAEAAVVGVDDDIKGQAIVAFVILREGVSASPSLEQEMRGFVAGEIGPIARPKRIVFTPDLPKTRSGKIMRRVLRAIAQGRPVGDVTTLANPDCVAALSEKI